MQTPIINRDVIYSNQFLAQLVMKCLPGLQYQGIQESSFGGTQSIAADSSGAKTQVFLGVLECYVDPDSVSGAVEIIDITGNPLVVARSTTTQTMQRQKFEGAFIGINVTGLVQYVFTGWNINGYTFTPVSPIPESYLSIIDGFGAPITLTTLTDMEEVFPGQYRFTGANPRGHMLFDNGAHLSDFVGNPCRYRFPNTMNGKPVHVTYNPDGGTNWDVELDFTGVEFIAGANNYQIKEGTPVYCYVGQNPIGAARSVDIQSMIDFWGFNTSFDAIIGNATGLPTAGGIEFYFGGVTAPQTVNLTTVLPLVDVSTYGVPTTQTGSGSQTANVLYNVRFWLKVYSVRIVPGSMTDYIHIPVSSAATNKNSIYFFSDSLCTVANVLGTFVNTGTWFAVATNAGAFRSANSGTLRIDLPANSGTFSSDYTITQRRGQQVYSVTPVLNGGTWQVTLALSPANNTGYNFYQLEKLF